MEFRGSNTYGLFTLASYNFANPGWLELPPATTEFHSLQPVQFTVDCSIVFSHFKLQPTYFIFHTSQLVGFLNSCILQKT